MRSLSSTVSEMPSSWLPSRSVVSKISIASAAVTAGSVDMLQPVLVAVDLALHGGEVDLLDLAGHRPRLAQLAVVDRADGHDLGCRPRQEGLVGGVEVGAQDVADLALVAQVAGD